jgi:hypothetical protein
MQYCESPQVEGTFYCKAHTYSGNIQQTSNASAPDKKFGCVGTIVVVVVALALLGLLFGDSTGGSSSSNEDQWIQCQARVIDKNTTNTIDYDGIDRCNRLYPKP